MRHISRETYVPSYFVIHSFMTKVETGQTYWTDFDLRQSTSKSDNTFYSKSPFDVSTRHHSHQSKHFVSKYILNPSIHASKIPDKNYFDQS